MSTLIIVSFRSDIVEIKQIKDVLADLIFLNERIVFFNCKGANQDIKLYLEKQAYHNYYYLGNRRASYAELFALLKDNELRNIIVIGLGYHDKLTNYLDSYIGTNIDIYLLAPQYGKRSDATKLINQGALLLSTRYDLI